MRCLPLLLLIAAPALAAPRHPSPPHPAPKHTAPDLANAPRSIGKWDAWQAATHEETGTLVCYAFTRASASTPAVPGRSDVILTVAERPGSRDAVAISAGFAFTKNAAVALDAGGTKLEFYTAGRSAFARDGKAAVTAFGKAPSAIAHVPGPRDVMVADTFSLRGFAPAYAAIQKACPPK